MPRTKSRARKFKSVAVPFDTWKALWAMAEQNHRSPSQQIAFLVDVTIKSPLDKEVLSMYAQIKRTL